MGELHEEGTQKDKWVVRYKNTYSDSVITDDTAMNMTDAYLIFNRICKSVTTAYAELRCNNITKAYYEKESKKKNKRG